MIQPQWPENLFLRSQRNQAQGLRDGLFMFSYDYIGIYCRLSSTMRVVDRYIQWDDWLGIETLSRLKQTYVCVLKDILSLSA